MRRPETRSGEVWVDRHYAALENFLHSGRQDGAALASAARSLAHVLEREPGYAEETRQLAAQFVMANWNAGWPEIIADAVRTGMDADIISPKLRSVPAPAAILHLFMAEARRIDGARLAGLDSLARAARRLEDAAEDDVLSRFLSGRVLVLRGELQELGGERVQALKDFRAAESALDPLMTDDTSTAAIADAWIAQIFGPADDGSLAGQSDALAAMALHQFNDSFVRALLGVFRTNPKPSDAEGLARLCDRVATHGLGSAVNPILVLPALSKLDPEASTEMGAFLAQAAAKAPESLTAGPMLAGLAPELRGLVKRLAQTEVDPVVVGLWELVTQVAAARGLARAGERAEAIARLDAAFRNAFDTESSAVGKALIIGELARQMTLQADEPDAAEGVSDLFLLVFEAAWRSDPEAFRDIRFRSQFDDAVAAVAARRLAQKRVAMEDDLRQLSVLLDLLRVTNMPTFLGLSLDAPFETPTEDLRSGFARMDNTLSRIADGMAGRFGAVALIAHDVAPGEGYLILVTEDGIEVARKDRALGKAFRNLAGAIDFAPDTPRDDAVFDPVRRPAEAAWQALPDHVRESIAFADVLHVAPDFRNADKSEPWEMLHDGDDYLLTSTVVIRHGSLRQMARAFDSRGGPAPRNRTLVVAAPNGDPARPLPTATEECARIGALLRAEGVDAPAISEDRLGADFLTDRLPWVDAVHVAAHGDWAVGTEYLLLSPKARLTVDDLLARHRRSVPFVYLNTCELGRTRYVGGGQARGLGYTLAELGAPAVVANTAAVLDAVSADVAVAFYENALDLPVGEALLAARQQVAKTWHPALVSSVILFGDADHRLFDADDAGSSGVVGAFLDAYFDGRDEEDRQATLNDPGLLNAILLGGPRAQAALDLVNGFSRVTPDMPYDSQIDEIGHAIALADELRHPCTMGMLRYIRAALALEVQDGANMRRWMEDAIAHLSAVENDTTTWTRALTRLRATLRRDRLKMQGLEPRYHGPKDESGALEAVMEIKLATEQAQEEERRPVEQRDIERNLSDVLWNAVVAGHPNRFEDTAEASAYAEIVTRKLVAWGAIEPSDADLTQPMLTALLWWIWSSQNVSFLSSDMVEGQAGTLRALVSDIAGGAIAAGDEPWRQEVLGFDDEVAAVLAELKEVPWERAHKDIPERLAALGSRAVAILDAVAEAAPEALAWAAAYVSGALATRNSFSVLEGQDYLYEGMAAAHRSVDHDNEGRFMRYLVEGFAAVREREPDELERWRMEGWALGASGHDEESPDELD